MEATPRYTASALVLLEPQKGQRLGKTRSSPDVNIDLPMLMENQIAIIRSTVFLRRVVER